MQVVVDDLMTTYNQSGVGSRVVLLLHGWADNHLTFGQLQKELAECFTVVSVDLPGFGATQAPGGVWGLEEYAEFVAAFTKKLNLAVFAIVAHSNGAAVAISGLASGVLRAEKLVLLAAAGIRDRQKGKRLALKVIAKGGKVATFWLPQKNQQALRKKLYGAAGSDMLVAPHLQETFKKTVRQDVQADAAKLRLPVLLVYGQKDKATPPLYGQAFHELMPNSTLEIVDGSHFVHHDQPELVSKLVKEFLV